MATLSAMFKLFDGYSSTADKIIRKTDVMTGKMLNASGATDKFNEKLKNAGAGSSLFSSGVGKIVGAAATLTTALKGMNITDEFINTNARIGLINDGLQTQAELQEKIFQSAKRARGSYTDMAGAISKMGLLADESFGSNDELIAFTELVQKSFKVGGASQSEQSSAMLQLSQAMAAGKLQGDEFRSIMENAPMIAQAIADYTGKSKGELKELSSEGAITADIIKNSMFAMSDEINSKFETMPITFADIWNRIKNGGLKAFNSVMTKTSELINTSHFQAFVDNMVNGFYLIAGAANFALDIISGIGNFIATNWGIIEPVLWGVIAALLVYNATAGIAYFTTLKHMAAKIAKVAVDWLEYAAIFALTVAQQGLNTALAACPITWIIIAVIALIALFYAAVGAINKLAGTSISATGIIAGVFWALGAVIYNVFAMCHNIIATFVNFLGNIFINPIAAVKKLFYEMALYINQIIRGVAKQIENLLNAIPFVEVNITGSLDKSIDWLKGEIEGINKESGLKDFVPKMDLKDVTASFNKGYNWGANLEDNFNLGSLLNGLGGSGIDSALGSNFGSDLGTQGNPLAVEGTGNNGSIDVEIADEDIKYLKDIAERDYVNKYTSATLAPNVTVQFGDVHENADANKVAGIVEKILREEIAVVGEG